MQRDAAGNEIEETSMQAILNADHFNTFGSEYLPGLVGVVVTQVGKSYLRAELPVRKALLAPNGYLHAGTVVTLADTACGFGCIANLPEGASSFTTIELKSNFMAPHATAPSPAKPRRSTPAAPRKCGMRS